MPAAVQRLGLADYHWNPRVTQGRKAYWYQTRTDADTAWKDFRHVELNPPRSFVALALDCDNPGSLDRCLDSATLPEPNARLIRKTNGHEQALWVLKDPVKRGKGARPKPVQFFNDIRASFIRSAQADQAYSGFLIRNPDQCDGFYVERIHDKRFTLADLAGSIVPAPVALIQEIEAEGRNHELFKLGMKLAGPESASALDVEDALWTACRDLGRFPEALPDPEVRGIIRSVLRYRSSWRENGWHSQSFLRRQSARGRRSGVARRKATADRDARILTLKAKGLTQAEIGQEVGLTQARVSQILRNISEPTQGKAGERSFYRKKNIIK